MLSFSRRVEFYLVFLSFEIEYDEFFIIVLRNVVVCMFVLFDGSSDSFCSASFKKAVFFPVKRILYLNDVSSY